MIPMQHLFNPIRFRLLLLVLVTFGFPLRGVLGQTTLTPEPDPGVPPTIVEGAPVPTTDVTGTQQAPPVAPPSIEDPRSTPPDAAALPGTPASGATSGGELAPTPDQSTPVPNIDSFDPNAQSGQETPDGNFSFESPNDIIYDAGRGLALAQGGFTFTYGGFIVRGERGVVDYNTNRATLMGNLTVTARGQVYTGKTLTFDLDTGEWRLSQIERTIPPEEFPPGTVLQPIYLKGGLVQGRDDDVTGENFTFSSCDRDHYYIRAKRLDFYRDQNGEYSRIALRRNSLHVFGRKILPLPVYVISLTGARSRRYGLQPTFGQNAFDGFFVKTLYDLSANARRTDSVLIDALQKRGLGLGLQRELANGAGLFYLYWLSGRQGGRQIDSRIRRDWRITSALTSTFNFQSTQNNSLEGQGIASRNGEWSFLYNTTRVRSNLLMRYANNQSSFSSFNDFGASLLHQQEFGRGFSIDASSLYARSNSSGTVNAATLDNTVTLTKRGSLFDALLRTELHDDLTGRNQRNGAYQLERIPELSLVSDTSRLRVPLLNRYLPGDVSLKLGRFNEPGTTELSRTDFAYGIRPRTLQLMRVGFFKSEVTAAGRFEQAFYSNDTARYNYDYLLNFNNTAGPFSAQVNYYKQRTHGYTPFQFDFLTPSESVDLTASFQPSPKFRLNLTTGRDLQNGFSRDVIARLQLAPSRSVYASIGASYSPETKTFGDLIGNFRFARNPNKFLGGTLDLGVRYSPQTNEFARINTTADIFITKKIRVQALSSYSGFTKTFDLNQVRISHDLHCFNLFTTYDQQRKQIRFDLALKAFPFLDTRFGQGRLGEGFDPFVGEVQ